MTANTTRPWIVVTDDGTATEHTDAHAALARFATCGAVTCSIIGPDSSLYADLDAVPTHGAGSWCERTGHLLPLVGSRCRRCHETVGVA